MVSNLGILIDSVDRNQETAESLMQELQERRDGVSAVSLDEEMINLVKYQNAYNAASKLLTVADEMMDTIMSTR
jgi:flagellar hook-associated protein 1 FlgK